MTDPIGYIRATLEAALYKLKGKGVSMSTVSSFTAEIVEGHVVIDCGGGFAEARRDPLTRTQERLCSCVAVSMRYLECYGSGSDEERVLANEWHKYEKQLLEMEKQALRPKGKRGKKQELFRAIERVCREINSRRWVDLLQALDNADLMNDLFYSGSDPIDIEVTEIDDIDKCMKYRTRRSEDKEVGFARLKNILSEIKI